MYALYSNRSGRVYLTMEGTAAIFRDNHVAVIFHRSLGVLGRLFHVGEYKA
jgi:hypothetical protein